MVNLTFLEHLLSPSLSSTFCGGEGDQSSRWDRSDQDDVKMHRHFAAGALVTDGVMASDAGLPFDLSAEAASKAFCTSTGVVP